MTSSKCRKKKFDDASQWLFEDWISTLAKGGEAKQIFQDCVNPKYANQFLYLRALLCKTMYCYRKDLPCTSVGNANSMVRNGLVPGGKSLKRGRQAVFFTAVNPMEDVKDMGETPCYLTKPRIAPYKNTWKRLQNTVCWCILKLAQEKNLQFHQTRSHAMVLCNTLPAACIKKAVCMKTQGELYSESSTCRAKIELPIWSTRSTKPRRKIILGTIERFEKLRGNL